MPVEPLSELLPCADARYFVLNSLKSPGILRVDADGGNLKRLTTDNNFYQPRWSPDGNWVAYVSNDPTGKRTLWRVPIDGGAPVQLRSEVTRFFSISPDGRSIA